MHNFRPVPPTAPTLIRQHRETMFRAAGWDGMAIGAMVLPLAYDGMPA